MVELCILLLLQSLDTAEGLGQSSCLLDACVWRRLLQVAQARVDWFREHQASKEQAAQAAVRAREAEWLKQTEGQLENRLKQGRGQ